MIRSFSYWIIPTAVSILATAAGFGYLFFQHQKVHPHGMEKDHFQVSRLANYHTTIGAREALKKVLLHVRRLDKTVSRYQKSPDIDQRLFGRVDGIYQVFLMGDDPFRILMGKDNPLKPISIEENKSVIKNLEKIGFELNELEKVQVKIKFFQLPSKRSFVGLLWKVQKGRIWAVVADPNSIFDGSFKLKGFDWLNQYLMNENCQVVYHPLPNRVGQSLDSLKVCAEVNQLINQNHKNGVDIEMSNFGGKSVAATLNSLNLSSWGIRWVNVTEVEPSLGKEVQPKKRMESLKREFFIALLGSLLLAFILSWFFWRPTVVSWLKDQAADEKSSEDESDD